MSDINDRIKELIIKEKLTNSEFAKRTNLNPSIVSHILSGRNKASLQVVESIKEQFTNVNLEYLITGNGELYSDFTFVKNPRETKTDNGRVKEMSSKPTDQEFSFKEEKTVLPNYSKEEDVAPYSTSVSKKTISVESQFKSLSKAEEQDKEIDQIVIFYADGSFKAYKAV